MDNRKVETWQTQADGERGSLPSDRRVRDWPARGGLGADRPGRGAIGLRCDSSNHRATPEEHEANRKKMRIYNVEVEQKKGGGTLTKFSIYEGDFA